MICPRCSSDIKFKERSYNTCPNCKKEFAFEPRSHQLLMTDKFFLKAVEKLSNKGKFQFTPQQFQIFLSRKRMKSNGTMIAIIVLSIVSSILIAVFFYPLLLFVIPFWIIVILAQALYFGKFVSLPQTFDEFMDSVVYRWKAVYGALPQNLLLETSKNKNLNYNLRGILFCETAEMANFMFANQVNVKLGLAVLGGISFNISQFPNDLPIYILHDATTEGCKFVEQVKQHFGNQRQVIDLGLRPQSVMTSKLMKFRQQNYSNNNFSSLNSTEIKWLEKGYFTPLFVLQPERLIQYVTKQIEQKSKQIRVDSPEKKAKEIGFMTWAGEK